MRRRIVEELILVAFLTFFNSSDINVDEEIENTNTVCRIEDTVDVADYVTLHPTHWTEEQEEIRNEIMYGELELLAILLQAEAGNQDELGKRYVADVVLNRVDDKDFPDTIEEVINQDNQFSVINDGSYSDAEWSVSEDCFRIALEEYEGPRKNTEILYFTSGRYNCSGTPSFIHGAHYFSTK